MTTGPMMPRPPRMVQRILRWAAPERLVDAIDGDLTERFEARARRDPVEARRWYRREVGRTVGPLAAIVVRDAPVIRWPLGLATGILVTSFAHDAVVGPLAIATGVPGSDLPLAIHVVVAGALAVLGSCAASRIAGARRRRGAAVVVIVLYGPAVVWLVRSPAAAMAVLPSMFAVISLAWFGAALGRSPPAPQIS